MMNPTCAQINARKTTDRSRPTAHRRVVIVGGDFLGPEAAKRLAGGETGEGCEQFTRGEYVRT